MKVLWLCFLLGLTILSGCTVPGLSQPTAIPTVSPTAQPIPTQVTSQPTLVPDLPTALLKKGTYKGPVYQKTVTLVNGNYSAGSGADALMMVMLPQIARGDLNQDGFEDAVILLGENGGGSGVFVSLVVIYNRSGEMVQGPSALIDDRPRVGDLRIQDGRIILSATIHGAGDAMASPTFEVTETYLPAEERLVLERLDSVTAAGLRRSIQIELPLAGAEVSSPLTLSGSLSVAPFENNLAYTIFDRHGEVLAAGSFLVQADAPGAPAVFDLEIELPSAAASQPIRLELRDVSMADGSPFALISLPLSVR